MPDGEVCNYARYTARLTIGEIEFYHRHWGLALAVLREEVELIVSQRTATVMLARKVAAGKRLATQVMEVRGLPDEQADALLTSSSGAAALAAYARAKDGDRIRRREVGV